MADFVHFISLGSFCSVALELERIGLRDASYPFDWCITEFEGVILAIENHFDGFFDIDQFAQSEENRSHYLNRKYGIQFFHDFDQYIPLREQLASVEKKYLRRIERFYDCIKQPTLFVRYISYHKDPDTLVNKELLFIEDNIERIYSLIKGFNPANDIIFIGNNDVVSDKIKIYHVVPDDNDTVARRPVEKNEELNKFLSSFPFPERCTNIERFWQKEHNKKKLINRIKMFIHKKTHAINRKIYIHNITY